MIILDSLEMPDELYWIDEHTWSSIKATTKRTIQGKHIVLTTKAPSDAGRTITLSSDDAWATRTVVETLFDWSNELGKELFLQMHDNRTYLCRFRHWDIPCVQADMVVPTAFPTADTLYKITLKLAVI